MYVFILNIKKFKKGVGIYVHTYCTYISLIQTTVTRNTRLARGTQVNDLIVQHHYCESKALSKTLKSLN